VTIGSSDPRVLSYAREATDRGFRRADDLLLIVATILSPHGLLLEHTLRVVFAKPVAAAIFLTVNGVLLGRENRPPAQLGTRIREQRERPGRRAGTPSRAEVSPPSS